MLISLAEWSINKPLFGGQMQHLDFAKIAKGVGIDAIEYVNQFFKDKAKDTAYLEEMNTRARGEGVTQVLIMCDGEGNLGDSDAAKRQTAVENHGGLSSNAKWLVQTIRMANHERAGTLPDFGNFRIAGPTKDNPDRKVESYDSYAGVAEMMPLARGVSVKPRVWDANGEEADIDLLKMMKIVIDAGYRGHCGIEYGPEGKELEGVKDLRVQLERVRDQLTSTRKS